MITENLIQEKRTQTVQSKVLKGSWKYLKVARDIKKHYLQIILRGSKKKYKSTTERKKANANIRRKSMVKKGHKYTKNKRNSQYHLVHFFLKAGLPKRKNLKCFEFQESFLDLGSPSNLHMVCLGVNCPHACLLSQ